VIMPKYRAFARYKASISPRIVWEDDIEIDIKDASDAVALGAGSIRFTAHCKACGLIPNDYRVDVQPYWDYLNRFNRNSDPTNSRHNVEERKVRLLKPTPEKSWSEKSLPIISPLLDSIFGSHEPSAEEVVHRLNEHYAKLEIFTAVNSTSQPSSPSGKKTAYRLAATDLFVEKAAEYLKARAVGYKFLGILAYLFSAIPVVIGIWNAHDGIVDSNKITPEILATQIVSNLVNHLPAASLSEVSNASAVAVATALTHNDYSWFAVSHFAITFTYRLGTNYP